MVSLMGSSGAVGLVSLDSSGELLHFGLKGSGLIKSMDQPPAKVQLQRELGRDACGSPTFPTTREACVLQSWCVASGWVPCHVPS